MTTIGFAGMSHLGTNMAVATASKGFSVIAFDDKSIITPLKQGNDPYLEPGWKEQAEQCKDSIQYIDDPNGLTACDFVFISRDVPTSGWGESDCQPVSDLIDRITPYLNDRAYCILLSQVAPGFTRTLQLDHSRLYYQVETLIFGQAMERALYPERWIIGAAIPSHSLPDAYQHYLDAFSCPCFVMGYESAELTKLAINAYLASSISYANFFSQLCERIGANWQEMVPALRSDKRIGQSAYINPGLGIGGGNIPRDLVNLMQMSCKEGCHTATPASWIASHRYHQTWIMRILYHHLFPSVKTPRIGLLGLAYKPNTSATMNSPAIALIKQFSHCHFIAYDPRVNALPYSSVILAKEAKEVLKSNLDALIITTPWPEFASLHADLQTYLLNKTIIDPFGLFAKNDWDQVNYYK